MSGLHPPGTPPVDARLLLAVRVISHQGHPSTAEDDVRPRLETIAVRYRELKSRLDFLTSAEVARTEWLANFLSENPTQPHGHS